MKPTPFRAYRAAMHALLVGTLATSYVAPSRADVLSTPAPAVTSGAPSRVTPPSRFTPPSRATPAPIKTVKPGGRAPHGNGGMNPAVTYGILGALVAGALLARPHGASAATPSPEPRRQAAALPVAISGRITDERGRPIAGASIVLRAQPLRAPMRRTAPRLGREAQTYGPYDEARAYVESDVNGRYAVAARLRAGAYLVEASAAGTAVEDVEQVVESGTTAVRNFILHRADAGTSSLPYAVGDIYFVTDRALVSAAPLRFGNVVAPDRTLSYGTCAVSVPLPPDATAAPAGYRFQRRVDPGSHALAGTATRSAGADEWYAKVRAERPTSVLVFVHGYAQTFDQAARAAAQLRYDLNVNGPVIAYSWPSHGDIMQYSGDEDQAAVAANNFIAFVERLRRELGPNVRLDVVAHSMGNRLVTDLLEGGAGAAGGTQAALDQIVMAAPDVYVERFTSRLGDVRSSAGHITIYASQTDQALLMSMLFHQDARLGYFGRYPVIVVGMDTVDATDVDTSVLGHGYFLDARTVESDLRTVFQGRRPPRDALQRVEVKKGFAYWKIAPP